MTPSASPARAEDHLVQAKVYGKQLEELPQDLYIPPDALAIYLDTFEGPLDLLLYLIRKANIDILDIPMTPLTNQYLAYVAQMRERNLDLAVDYLLMAATLLDIKSRMLLPRPINEEVEDDMLDPRAELIQRLLVYEQIKKAAQIIDALPMAERDFDWSGVEAAQAEEVAPKVALDDLQMAWLAVLKKAAINQHHQVKIVHLSVREHMSLILKKLKPRQFVSFESLFENTVLDIRSYLVHFLAILELVREKIVHLSQSDALSPIYIRLSGDMLEHA